jgi:hypothetical protein
VSPLRGVAKPVGQCWTWTGATSDGGYGVVRWGGKIGRVHRLVYEAMVGPITAGLDLDHLCRNRACYNPAHLEPVTRGENIRRGLAPAIGQATSKRRAEQRTHCPHGHPYDDENTNLRPGRGRECRTCKQGWSAAAYQKRKSRVV